MTYSVYTAAAGPPVSTADAATHCRISGSADNTWLASAVLAATALLETYTGRSFVHRTYDLYLDAFPGSAERDEWSRIGGDEAIELRKGPISSVTDVHYTPGGGAEVLLDASRYLVDTKGVVGRVVPAFGQVWPTDALNPVNGVRVRYVAGYGASESAIPDQIKAAVKTQVAEWYENRGDDPTLANGGFGTMPLGEAAKLAVSGMRVVRI